MIIPPADGRAPPHRSTDNLLASPTAQPHPGEGPRAHRNCTHGCWKRIGVAVLILRRSQRPCRLHRRPPPWYILCFSIRSTYPGQGMALVGLQEKPMPQPPLGTPDDRPSRWPRRGVEASSGPACPAAGESSDTPTPSRGQLNAECQSVLLPPKPTHGCSMPPPQTHQPSRPLPGQRFVWNPEPQSVRPQ
jgi:hypothetical protein